MYRVTAGSSPTSLKFIRCSNVEVQADETMQTNDECAIEYEEPINFADIKISIFDFFSILSLIPECHVHSILACISLIDDEKNIFVSRRLFFNILSEFPSSIVAPILSYLPN